MPTKDNNIIKYNHGEKSIKMPFTIYADLECLLEKIDTFENDPNKHIYHRVIQNYTLFIR